MAKRGRPTKEPSAEDRAKVKELLAENSTIAEMARLFGYSAPTFRKYFSAEILPQKRGGKVEPAPAGDRRDA
jgi:DNA invertase Pin-like site-specific DNA recombinase